MINLKKVVKIEQKLFEELYNYHFS